MDAAERFRAEEEERYRAEEPALQPAPIPAKAEKKRKTPVKRNTPTGKIWMFTPVADAVIFDTRFTLAERGILNGIFAAINKGKWNKDLYSKASYRELADKLGCSRWTVMRTVEKAVTLGVLRAESLSRGGMKFTFTLGPEAFGIAAADSEPAA